MRRRLKLAWRSLRMLRERLNPQPSYAQHAEDLVLKRLLGPIAMFIDIGANDGLSVSNSFLFALEGARGLCFEPVRATYQEMAALYRWSRRVVAVQEGISNQDVELEIVSDGLLSAIPATDDPALSAILKPFRDPAAGLEKIRVRPLGHWLKAYPQFLRADFVSIDTEGHELSVLLGMDFQVLRPRCVILETHGISAAAAWWHRDYQAMDELLQRAGYSAVLRSPNNTFWLEAGLAARTDFSPILREFPAYTTPALQPPGSGAQP